MAMIAKRDNVIVKKFMPQVAGIAIAFAFASATPTRPSLTCAVNIRCTNVRIGQCQCVAAEYIGDPVYLAQLLPIIIEQERLVSDSPSRPIVPYGSR